MTAPASMLALVALLPAAAGPDAIQPPPPALPAILLCLGGSAPMPQDRPDDWPAAHCCAKACHASQRRRKLDQRQ